MNNPEKIQRKRQITKFFFYTIDKNMMKKKSDLIKKLGKIRKGKNKAIQQKTKRNKNLKIMGKTKELFTKLREEEFLKEHIIVCTLKPEVAVTTASNNKE